MEIKDFEEKKVGGTLIFDGKVVRLEKDDILLPDGKPAIREVIRHPGAVAVVPVTDRGEVICVRQYRYPHAKTLLEIPAGKLERGEDDHEAAARRELREETGALAGRMTFLGEYYSSPAILDEVIYLYLAEELTFGDMAPDEDEFLSTEKLPLEELCRRVMNGEVPDGKTQTAVLKAKLLLDGRA